MYQNVNIIVYIWSPNLAICVIAKIGGSTRLTTWPRFQTSPMKPRPDEAQAFPSSISTWKKTPKNKPFLQLTWHQSTVISASYRATAACGCCGGFKNCLLYWFFFTRKLRKRAAFSIDSQSVKVLGISEFPPGCLGSLCSDGSGWSAFSAVEAKRYQTWFS